MARKKNAARLQWNGKTFHIWQDEKDNWLYTFENLFEVNSGHKELQPALNQIYETIDEQARRTKKASK